MHIILKPASLFIKIKPDYPVTCFSLVMRPCHFRMQRSTSFVWASENLWASQVALVVKNPPVNAGNKRCRLIPGSWRSPGRGMATHSSILAWRIPWTEEPGKLQSVGLQRVRNNWRDLARTHAENHYWCGYSKMYLALCLLMTPWVVSNCSISATVTNTPCGRALCTWEHFSRQRCGLTVVDSLGPSLCTSTARSSSTNTTYSILTNSRKGVCALKLLATVAIMNLFKIVQIWWVKNVSLVLYGLHYFASEAELSSLLSAICSSELLLDFSFEWFIFYLLFVGIRYIPWILILSICICCR